MSQPHPIIAANVPSRSTSTYPANFAQRLIGREKQTLGDRFGLKNFGVNRTTLKPGAMSALRHWHSCQDEFIYILSGSPTLITNAGETVLEAGMCIGFPAAHPDGHHLVNRSTEDAVYLEIGDRSGGDFVTYPDDDLQAVTGSNQRWQFQHQDGSPY